MLTGEADNCDVFVIGGGPAGSTAAALLARSVGAPVRLQLSREQEHALEPKGAAQLMDVDGGLTASV